ncbi:MAG: efflux RND transporter periplasmic adaptor subunit [Gammaproteobacteria bacterium]|jgi:Cu(I)/Ag(I) efflux system membrane fusion protein
MNRQAVAAALIALALGGAGGYWAATSPGGKDAARNADAGMASAEPDVLFYRNPMNPAITSPVPAQDEMGMDYIPVYAEDKQPNKEPEILYYRNPMNPAITSPVPAQDEMGMDYIPVYVQDDAGTESEPAGTVRIDPVTVQNIGVRTAVSEQQSLSRHIRAVGHVTFDEERLSRLHPKTEGWIEELYIDKTGEQIDKDAILLNIYSPQLVTSQQEYLLALNNLDVLRESPYEEIRRGAQELVSSARERLELLDVPEHQIRELEQSRKIKKNLHIHSPFDGVIINIGAREGQYVTPATELYQIADLSRVWVFADVYENEIPWIQVGDPADMKLTSIPGKLFSGRVGYIYPYAEAKTRTIKVRLEFDNPDMLLKPDMFADVTIHAQRKVDAIVIPAEAVVRSGEREQVFVVREPGKFEPRDVKLGVTAKGMVQVIEGVSPGERVVTSSQFLIDSESKLREATAKMLDTMNGVRGGGDDTGNH